MVSRKARCRSFPREIVHARHDTPAILGLFLRAARPQPGQGLGTGGLGAPGGELELRPLVPHRPLEADLVAAHGVDDLLEAGQVDEGEVIDVLADDRFHRLSEGSRAVQSGTTLQRVIEPVLAPRAAHVVDE